MDSIIDVEQLKELIQEAKSIAAAYKRITGKSLGITGEVAEYEAARLFGLDLMGARYPGYDAIRRKDQRRVQIKGRIRSQRGSTQRLGSINTQHEWDIVILIILDDEFNPIDAYETMREDVIKALADPGSKSRNIRGQMSVSKFKSISEQILSNGKVTSKSY